MRILALEASTVSAKAMLYETGKGIVAAGTERYGPQAGDLTIQDMDEVCSGVLKAGRTVAAGQPVDIISLGSTWHNVALCDRQMQPATMAYTWAYTGAAPSAERIRLDRERARALYEKTGCPVHALFPSVKLCHFREMGMELGDKWIVDTGSYLFYRMTGRRRVTRSMASGTGLLNIHSGTYEPDSLALSGISPEQLGELCTYRDTAPLAREAAALLDQPAGTPILPAHPDGALNQVGAGALDGHTMTLSVGTSAALRLSLDRPWISGEGAAWCYLSPTAWLAGAATAGACNCTDWCKEHFFPAGASYREIEEQPSDWEALPVFLPFLFGERCPGWHAGRLGGFSGLRGNHSAPDLYHSVQEGVVMNIKQCFDHLSGGLGAPEHIRVSGGILRSRLWLQLLADVLEQPLSWGDSEQESLLGGVVLARAALDPGFRPEAFHSRTAGVILPREDKAALCRRRYQRYLAEYSRSWTPDGQGTA